MTHAVLFDLDGVLIDSFDIWLEVTRAAVRELGDGGDVTREEFLARWGQSVAADVARWFPRSTVAELEAYYRDGFAAHLAHVRVDPEAAPLVAWLRARGVATAVVTNTPGPIARQILRHAGIEIPTVVGGTDVPAGKPAPDMLLRALALLGAERGAALMVGDTENDLRAAAAAGVRFVGLRLDAAERIEQLAELRTRVDSMGARAAPRHGA